MKITIPRQDLLDTVNKVKSVVSAKSALPILSHILMETDGSSVRLTATDLKVSIECTVDCDVLEEGTLTVSSQRLSSMLAEMPDKDIELNLLDNNVIEIKCGQIETKLFSMSPEEFPPVRSFDGIEPLVFKQSVLASLFAKTSFAICTDQARYNLTGLLFEVKGSRVTAVATDGRRMSMCIDDEAIEGGGEFKVIIPSKMIHELERLFSGDADVQVFIDESHAAFVFDRLRLVTSLIEGNFPNYEMVMPKRHDKEVILDTALLTEAVRRTRTMTNDKFNSVRLIIAKGNVMFRVMTPEVGEYEEDMDAEYDGENIEIAFNPDFMHDVLRHVESEKVCLALKDGANPGILKPYTEAPEDNYINVIMPIRI